MWGNSEIRYLNLWKGEYFWGILGLIRVRGIKYKGWYSVDVVAVHSDARCFSLDVRGEGVGIGLLLAHEP